jgi:sugar/nucleoside kinase (ribokinase family)
MGKVFHDDMVNAGINAHLSQSHIETGRAVALIGPDTERTFATYLGAAIELNRDDLSPELFYQYDIFHVEGYIVQNHALLETALKLARETGLKISLDLASYNVVDQNRDFLEKMLKEYVDIVFANEDEARSLTGLEPAEALEQLAGMCETAVVKIGREGSLARSGNLKVEIGVIDVNCIDTTGAGDLYAAGFLYGIVHEFPLEKCGRIGAILAGKVIEIIGPKLDETGWKAAKGLIKDV